MPETLVIFALHGLMQASRRRHACSCRPSGPSHLIPNFIQKWEEGFKIVVESNEPRKNSFYRIRKLNTEA